MTDEQTQADSLRVRVEAVMEAIRPALQADGGDVELVEIVDNVVKVRLQGACAGCPFSQMTLRDGIEKTIKQHVPEITGVESAD